MRVVAFCAVAALIVGVLFGIAPAWQATSFSSPEVMGSDSRTTTGGGGRLRSLLVMGEVATAVLLLFGAGLLLRTLMAVESFDRGFKAQNVLTMLVDPLGSTYPTPEKLRQFFDQVEADTRALPGVQDVAWSSAVPLGESVFGEYPFTYDGRRRCAGGSVAQADDELPDRERVVFFDARSRDRAGRNFDPRDTPTSPRVAIVNEAFARSLGGRNPIGLQVAVAPADSPNDKPTIVEIVGVAKQVKQRPDETTDFIQLYTPLAQDLVGDIMLMVRSQTDRASALAPSVRAIIENIDRSQTTSVASVTTLEDVEWAATGRHRFRAVMVSAFAALAVVLAMVGVFGILAYSVQMRIRDFGLRRALGATTGDVLRLVVGGAAKVVVAGVVIGLVLSAAFARLITTMLFGVQPLDFVTFAIVTIVLGIMTAIAIAGPAWRAARIDPAQALRTK